ncbi:(d)CMP kinase [Boseongicola aestuarii]|uniref:Cytidylate kinase n=1 Tax=Boseongicola aestuarii TaxID=1470561 RepID=A0A238IZ62_9RHOB|nr:d(CMP) kinase [Boseongicola aestuarii]SMX23778.1 Cytidylate kinase [Boseongicola aestuarii]
MRFTVAIDGPAAAGKGTISRGLAERFGFAHLDTGLLYRATGRKVLETGLAPEAAARAVGPEDLARDGLRTQAVAELASRVATVPEVRHALVAFQRDFARRDGGAVLDGRDIGTVICPDAEVKLYVTASAEVRARRRFEELRASGQASDYEDVLDEVLKRDARDMGRKDAPMRAAEDAVQIDTSEMDIDDALAAAVAVVEARLQGRGT